MCASELNLTDAGSSWMLCRTFTRFRHCMMWGFQQEIPLTANALLSCPQRLFSNWATQCRQGFALIYPTKLIRMIRFCYAKLYCLSFWPEWWCWAKRWTRFSLMRELVPYSFSIIHGIAEYVSTRGCQKESRPYCKVLLLFLWIAGYEMINRLIHWTNWMRVKETKELRHTKRGQGSSGPLFSPFHRDFLLFCSNRGRKAHQSAFSAFTYPQCLELCRDGKAWLFAGCWSTTQWAKIKGMHVKFYNAFMNSQSTLHL